MDNCAVIVSELNEVVVSRVASDVRCSVGGWSDDCLLLTFVCYCPHTERV